MQNVLTTKQTFKAVYFPDFKERDTKSKSFTLAFSDSERDIYDSIGHLSSLELRNILGVDNFSDLEDLAAHEGLPINRFCIWRLKKALNDKTVSTTLSIDPIHTTLKGSSLPPLKVV
jgi:hypothetical protein